MLPKITYRQPEISEALKLSVLFQQVYIHTYGQEGVSEEFAQFISQQFSPERLRKLIETDPERFVVAVNNQNFVGAAEIEWHKPCPIGNLQCPELSKLYVLDWFTAKGIGYGLLDAVEHTLRSKMIPQYWVWVLATNSRAINFYVRQQFQPLGKAWFQMEENRYENEVFVKSLLEPNR